MVTVGLFAFSLKQFTLSLPVFIMCTGKCAHCVGQFLIPMSLICISVNSLLLVPNGEAAWIDNLSREVWYMAGFFGGGLMVLYSGIAATRASGKGCCGIGCCGNRFRMLRSVFSSFFGMIGALYCLTVSSVALENGPKCLVRERDWMYPFENTSSSYLTNSTLWSICLEPPNVVLWNVTLFSILMAISSLEFVLCGVQVVNASIGVFCGDCRKKRGQRGTIFSKDTHHRAVSSLSFSQQDSRCQRRH